MVELSKALADEYMKNHPQALLAVKAGGSATGITALLDGTTDLVNASRKMNPKEFEDARLKGINPQEYIIGLDGIALIVNRANPVKSLNFNQLKGIFTGNITNWKQVGGMDLPIVAVTREANSGTYAFFQEHILNNAEYLPNAFQAATSNGVVSEVAETPGAIGYLGMAYANNSTVQTVSVSARAGDQAFAPTEENVQKGIYPLARALRVYSNGNPGGEISSFIDFMLSPSGQQIVRKIGFTPIK